MFFHFPPIPTTRCCLRALHSNAANFPGFHGRNEFLASAKTVASLPQEYKLPEVIVAGRANAGKSTLLNAVLGSKSLIRTSSKAGHTRALNFFRVGQEPGKLILVDAPGYGARGRPEWGELFDHYILSRKQLRRVYILLNAKHGIKEVDVEMLRHLSSQMLDAHGRQPWTLQSVITKADTVPVDQLERTLAEMKKRVWEAAPLCLPPVVTSAEMSPPFGIDQMRDNIAEACGL